MARSNRAVYPYPRPALTVDVVLLTLLGDALSLLLIQRKELPFAGGWALPGGFVNENEPIRAAALRELKEETNVGRVELVELGAYGDPGRDPRGWTISIAFTALAKAKKLSSEAGDDAAAVRWFPANALPPLAFDHDRIIADGLAQVRRDAINRIAEAKLLPSRFPWPDFVRVVENVLGACVDGKQLLRQGLKSGWLLESGETTHPKTAKRRKLYSLL